MEIFTSFGVHSYPYFAPRNYIRCELHEVRNTIAKLAEERLLILSYRKNRQKMPIFGNWEEA